MITVFVEGRTDEVVLTRLMADFAAEGLVRIVASGSRDAARPLARKQLLVAKEPVALVIDSDTTDPTRISEQQRDLEDYLRFGAQGVGFAVIQFVPQVEVIFFQKPAALQRALGQNLDPNAIVAGKFAPRAMLEQLMTYAGIDSFASMVARLGEADLIELRRVEPVAALRHFVRQTLLGSSRAAATRSA